MWQVTVRNKDLGQKKNITGDYRLCLTCRQLLLVKMPIASLPVNSAGTGADGNWEFPLMNIRRCGHSNCVFFMELGRGSVTGAGELFMESDEASVAQAMHSEIINAMRNCAKEDLAPRQRTRSSSANEQNRPPSLSSSAWPPSLSSNSISSNTSSYRMRADSCRSRTASECVIVTPPGHSHLHDFVPSFSSSSPPPPPPPAAAPPPTGFALLPSSAAAAAAAVCPALTSPSVSTAYLNDSAASSYNDYTDYDGHSLAMSQAADSYHGSGSGNCKSSGGGGGRSRYSHAATPENSLPKESTILEEDSTANYLTMTLNAHRDGCDVTDYMSMSAALKTSLSSSPVIRTGGHMRSLSASSTGSSSSRPITNKARPSFPTPPIKPPLHQNPYMDMSSPGSTGTAVGIGIGWSPTNAPDGYMNMNGCGGGGGPGSVGTRSGTHTRSSSFGEDVTDFGGYVPMAPLSVANSSANSREEIHLAGGDYMEMNQLQQQYQHQQYHHHQQQQQQRNYRRSLPRDVNVNNINVSGRGRISPASSGSVASSLGTACSSVAFGASPVISRLQEYHLEKVASLLAPSPSLEDDDELSSLRTRQSRAYSVGSRPDLRTNKLATKIAANGDSTAAATTTATATKTTATATADARVRAYSVGSRAVNVNGSPNNQLSSECSLNSSRADLESSSPNGNQTATVHGVEPARKKSLSVPTMLGSSPVSASWTNPTGTFLRTLGMGALGNQHQHHHNHQSSVDSSLDQPDTGSRGDKDDRSSCLSAYGSSESVGRASVSSSNSALGTTGARVRPVSRSSSTAAGRVASKTRDRKGRPELERLESVPQGRDQDYIEFGENKAKQQQQQQQLLSADIGDVTDDLSPSRPGSSLSLIARRGLKNSNNNNNMNDDDDSTDEYVQLVAPRSSHGATSCDSPPRRCSIPQLSVDESQLSPRSPPVEAEDYMAMDFSKPNAMAAAAAAAAVVVSLRSEPCPIVGRASTASNVCIGSSSTYMEMSGTHPSPCIAASSSQPASVSDGESYLPMDFTPTTTPRSSCYPSRQSSQVLHSFIHINYNCIFIELSIYLIND